MRTFAKAGQPGPVSLWSVVRALAAACMVALAGCSGGGSGSNGSPGFEVLEPADGQRVEAGTVCLSFRVAGQEGQSAVYDVYFGTRIDQLKVLVSNHESEYAAASDLKPDSVYYWRVTATDSGGVKEESPIMSFLTGHTLTVADRDGNEYATVQIGNQIWMAQNLRTQTYRNGEPIPNITEKMAWVEDKAGAWCAHPEPGFDRSTYGLLYNWYAVNNASGLAPGGWRVANDGDFATLMDYLGGDATAGGPLKETGIEHWIAPNAGATNGSGFTALPGGHRETSDGDFDLVGANGFYWSASDASGHSTNYRGLGNRKVNTGRYTALKNAGFSVRCLRGAPKP